MTEPRQPSQRTIIGRITGDPQLSDVTSENQPEPRPVAKFSVAENHGHQEAGRWVKDQTTFWDVTARDHQAENATNDLNKGDRVIVVGRWEADREYDRRDGSKGVKANEVSAYEIGPSLRYDDLQERYEQRQAKTQKQSAGVDAGVGL